MSARRARARGCCAPRTAPRPVTPPRASAACPAAPRPRRPPRPSSSRPPAGRRVSASTGTTSTLTGSSSGEWAARLDSSPARLRKNVAVARLLTHRALHDPDAVGHAVELEVPAQVGDGARVRLECHHGRAALGRERREVAEVGSDVEHHGAVANRIGERPRGRALAILLLKLAHVVRVQGGVAAEDDSADLLAELAQGAQRRRAGAVDSRPRPRRRRRAAMRSSRRSSGRRRIGCMPRRMIAHADLEPPEECDLAVVGGGILGLASRAS